MQLAASKPFPRSGLSRQRFRPMTHVGHWRPDFAAMQHAAFSATWGTPGTVTPLAKIDANSTHSVVQHRTRLSTDLSSLSVAGYNYTVTGLLLSGLSPAGMAASLAARTTGNH